MTKYTARSHGQRGLTISHTGAQLLELSYSPQYRTERNDVINEVPDFGGGSAMEDDEDDEYLVPDTFSPQA